jgi:hypothetical protein
MVSFQKLCLLSLCSLIANARVSHGFVPSASQKRASGASQLVSPAEKELLGYFYSVAAVFVCWLLSGAFVYTSRTEAVHVGAAGEAIAFPFAKAAAVGPEHTVAKACVMYNVQETG